MDNQQIFDKVLAHLRKQGVPAQEPDGSCCYRTDDGRMCAVGCLIPDEKYIPLIEGDAAGDARVLRCLPFEVNSNCIRLLESLQCAHDGELKKSIEDWEDEMASIAAKFGLTYTAPESA